MRKLFFKSMLLLCALIVGSNFVWADSYVKVSSSEDLVAGEEYILACTSGDNTYVVTSSFSNNIFSTTTSGFTVSSSTITITSANPMIVTLGGSSEGYTLSYADGNSTKYIGHASSSNNLNTGTSATTNYYKWTWNSTNYALINKGKTTRYMGYNGNNGVKSYATSNYNNYPIACLYKKNVSATALEVKTAPTKLNYKIGEKLDLTGLVLDATIGENHIDVTSGYTAKIGETTVTSGTTTLNDVGAKTVTFTYGGQTATRTIHVGDLESIALTTTGVKTTYNQGQTFDPENLVVTATYSDSEETPTTWTEDVTASCTYDPNGALGTSDNNVEVSYTLGTTTKTADIAITVNAATAYTVTFDAGTGSCGISSLTEASGLAGVELPTATISVTGWSFAGWATASTTNTETAPTLYAAGDTYHPVENCTLHAVYKFSEVTAYKRATDLSDITSASSIVIVANATNRLLDSSLGGSVNAPNEASGKISAASTAIFTLAGNNTDGFTLTYQGETIGTANNSDGTAITLTSSASFDKWKIASHNTSNTFYFENKVKEKFCLEHYGGSWLAYAPNTPASNANMAMKVYVPVIVYNSNPAAMINPTIAWTTAGNKSLYVKDDATYDNAANVTGISKTPTYTSSDETVATISEAGVVTALKAGSTTITAKVAKEVGVNSEASVTYDVTVKDAKTIAGLKAITSSSSVVTFTADLTDAVVTYVKGNHAFIQDASGAVYASCGGSLTAGKEINGAISGSIKAANQIDEITAIDLSDATITDGVIPGAAVITAATLAANKADYEGKLVSIAGATVTASLANGSASGGKISDDSKVTEINLYAPDSNIDALKDAEGTFNGYITLYGGSTVRLNIFEQSQITLTKNAPTAQTLTFASDAVELDEETSAYSAFTGQAVSGAVGTVTYSVDSDDDDVVTSINASTGAVELSGNCGTATIMASAAAKDVTVAGVTTPYIETTKTYTVTVYPRYIVTFSVNGVETEIRQASHGASVDVPSPSDLGAYKFQSWSTSTVTPTDEKPSMTDLGATITPENNSGKYYAVFALEAVGEDELITLLNNSGSNSTDATSGITVAGTTNDNNGNPAPGFNMKDLLTISNINLVGYKAPSSLVFDYKPAKANSTYTTFVVKQYNSSNTLISTTNVAGTDHTKYTTCDAISIDLNCTKITINSSGTNVTTNCYVDNVKIQATRAGVTYSDYRTTMPDFDLTTSDNDFYGLYLPWEVAIPDGIEAYTGDLNNEETALTITKIQDGYIPAATAVIVKSPNSTGTFTFTASAESVAPIAVNDLRGVAVSTPVDDIEADNTGKTCLTLGSNGTSVGFRKPAGTSIAANKVYLLVTTPQNGDAPSAIRIVEGENNATNIENLDASEEAVKFIKNGQLYIMRNGVVYDAVGRLIRK